MDYGINYKLRVWHLCIALSKTLVAVVCDRLPEISCFPYFPGNSCFPFIRGPVILCRHLTWFLAFRGRGWFVASMPYESPFSSWSKIFDRALSASAMVWKAWKMNTERNKTLVAIHANKQFYTFTGDTHELWFTTESKPWPVFNPLNVKTYFSSSHVFPRISALPRISTLLRLSATSARDIWNKRPHAFV